MYYYLIALIVIAVDQITKLAVVKWMEVGESIPLIDSFLYLTSHRNAGAAFGILENQRIFFIVTTLVVVIAIIYMLEKERQINRVSSIALSLIMGGAIGNFIDRLFSGKVVDFIDVYIFTYDYPIFNVADSAIVIGVFLFILDMLVLSRKNG
ncbi:signal peptidase II [Rubeoparvulum massiliense]|uniref:signal peptidase II n=1 Tax=Rubeoparvulum massiliense TaxID=1631346 RepID=UPI00065E9152|nr:signal peptidase II [Rubeoparvulum massiliense]